MENKFGLLPGACTERRSWRFGTRAGCRRRSSAARARPRRIRYPPRTPARKHADKTIYIHHKTLFKLHI